MIITISSIVAVYVFMFSCLVVSGRISEKEPSHDSQ